MKMFETEDSYELSERPKEGDLIYFPLGERLFEIKFVEHEKPFYQLKKNYVYTLNCELFRYEDEVIDTNIADIDCEVAQIGHIQTLTMVGGGTTATALSSYCASGSVSQIHIKNMGKKYTKNPMVGFTSAPIGGMTATGIASITNEYIQCNGLYGGMINSILLTNAGCGYTVPPMVTIQSVDGDDGVGAAATAGISTGGSVMAIQVTSGGSGYITAPTVSFSTGSQPIGFVTATGVASISSSGIVTAIYITNSGNNYDSAPTVVLSDPPAIASGIGTTNYIFNEVVTGETSGTTARVKEWNVDTNTLEISIVDGDFTPGEIVVGEESKARFMVSVQEKCDLVSGFADNDTIEAEAKDIIDFTQQNPFGMP